MQVCSAQTDLIDADPDLSGPSLWDRNLDDAVIAGSVVDDGHHEDAPSSCSRAVVVATLVMTAPATQAA